MNEAVIQALTAAVRIAAYPADKMPRGQDPESPSVYDTNSGSVLRGERFWYQGSTAVPPDTLPHLSDNEWRF